MKKYELFLVLPGTLDEKESEAKMNEVLSIINESGVDSVVKVMGKNRLAYPINNVRYGYFYTVIFEAEPQNIKIVEDKLKLSRGLLRAVLSGYNSALEGSDNKRLFGDGLKNDFEDAEEKADLHFAKTDIEKDAILKSDDLAEPVEQERQEKITPAESVARQAEEKIEKMDLKEIDKKLDEILSDDNINI